MIYLLCFLFNLHNEEEIFHFHIQEHICVNKGTLGEGLRRSLTTPDPFVLTNKLCLNQ